MLTEKVDKHQNERQLVQDGYGNNNIRTSVVRIYTLIQSLVTLLYLYIAQITKETLNYCCHVNVVHLVDSAILDHMLSLMNILISLDFDTVDNLANHYSFCSSIHIPACTTYQFNW